MCAIFVVVGNVFGQQPFQVTFIEGDDVIQQVPAAAAYPALRDPVLPRTFKRSLDRAHI
jgi:hypothetical protein